jgi:hypothetical protein
MGVQPWGTGRAKGWILVKGMGSLSGVGWELLGWDFECFLVKVDGGKAVDGSKVSLDLKIGEVGCWDLESRL